MPVKSKSKQDATPLVGYCPSCHSRMACIDSRKSERYTRRRWRCECGQAITTVEIPMVDYEELRERAGQWLPVMESMDRLRAMLDAQLQADVKLVNRIKNREKRLSKRAGGMLKMHKAGFSVNAIASAYGVEGHVVRRALKRGQKQPTENALEK